MRRDVYIENDSGGFSVLAADAVDDIIADARSDDFRFVANHKFHMALFVRPRYQQVADNGFEISEGRVSSIEA